MNTEQVVQALVAPNTGVIFKILDRIQSIENGNTSVAAAVESLRTISEESGAAVSRAVTDSLNAVSKVTAIEEALTDLTEKVAALAARVEELAAAPAPAPKRTRKKKEPEPAPEEPAPAPVAEEPEVIDPEAPAYEPGLVPDEVAGISMTGEVVLSVRNNIKVLTLDLAKTLDPDMPSEVYDFVAGLSDDEVNAIVEKFPR